MLRPVLETLQRIFIPLMMGLMSSICQAQPLSLIQQPEPTAKSVRSRDLSFDPKAPDWSVMDAVTQSLKFTAYRTDPATWSAEGGYGLRWGMGPGDVSRALPEMKQVFGNSPDLQVSTFTQEVQGKLVTVFLRFFRGRLYEVMLRSFVSDSRIPSSYDEIVNARRTSWEWREKIRKIVGDSYGAPICEPSARTRVNLCDTGDGSGVCSSAESGDMREKLLRWVWRTAETEISITGSGIYAVTYKDLLMHSVVQQAEARSREAFKQQQERKEALERERLAGQKASPEKMQADAQIQMDFSIPPLQCWADPGPSADDRTPPSNWSSKGFDQWRWGMGPGDVKAVMDASGPMTWTLGNRYLPDRLTVERGLMVKGVRGAAIFEFEKGRLTQFIFLPECDTKNTKGTGCATPTMHLKGLLTKNWGTPTCDFSDDKEQEVCRWDSSPQAWVESTHHGRAQMLKFAFSDPKGKAFRHKPDPQANQIAPKSWHSMGWADFKWGMGITDAARVLSDKDRPYKAIQAMSCFKQEQSIEVICKLNAAAHQFRVMGQAPDLEFEFKDRKLTQIRLEYGRDISRQDFWATAEKMRDAMVSRYGKPDDHYDNSERMRSLIERWNGTEFEGGLYALDGASRRTITVMYRLPKSDVNRSRKTESGL